MNTWREVFLCSFEWCLPHQPHPLLLQWSCYYMTPSFHHPRVWSCILLSQIWIQPWSHLYKRAHTPHLQDELHWCQGRGSFCFPQSLQWNHCGMQFLGLKSKENILVFILKKQQQQQPKAFYNVYLNFHKGFFLYSFKKWYSLVCGDSAQRFTTKQVKKYKLSLSRLVHNSISHVFYNPRELERLFFNSAYNHKHTYLLHHQSPFLLDWHLWEVLNS